MLNVFDSVFNPSLIEVYDNALTERECEILISQFERTEPEMRSFYHDGLELGQYGNHVDGSYKKCKEPSFSFTDKSVISNIIFPVLSNYINKYLIAYNLLDQMRGRLKVYNRYNVQKYETEDDGFKEWHCEHAFDKSSRMRTMAWMFYVNNAKSGTYFYDHSNVRAKIGRLVIWPAGWTHVHRGAPNKGLKYIVTGWVGSDII